MEKSGITFSKPKNTTSSSSPSLTFSSTCKYHHRYTPTLRLIRLRHLSLTGTFMFLLARLHCSALGCWQMQSPGHVQSHAPMPTHEKCMQQLILPLMPQQGDRLMPSAVKRAMGYHVLLANLISFIMVCLFCPQEFQFYAYNVCIANICGGAFNRGLSEQGTPSASPSKEDNLAGPFIHL